MKRYSLIVMAGLLSAPVAWASTPAHGAPIPGPISPAQAVQRLSPAIRKLASPNRLQVRRLESNLSAKLRHTLAAQPQQAMQNLVSQRSQILRLLGVPANKTGYVYYFVSTSMPTALLKAYARDAIWDGGMLVFRGIVPGHGIGWFLRHVMLKLKHVTVDGSTPTVTIDPNLYDAYGVRLVPAIVYSAMQPWETCAQTIPATLVTGGKTVRYHRCAPEGAKSYWKVSGAVSTWYALSRFHAVGAPGTGRLLRAMRAGAIPAGSRHEAGLTRPAPGPGNLAGVLAAINGKTPRESAATLLAPADPQQ
jgi:type-F conjugative transfer system pilin assembly protein TrbC